MNAMILEQVGAALRPIERRSPDPSAGELRIRVEACAVCRTDLHVADGDLPSPKLPVVPGHEIVGIVEAIGQDADPLRLGRRVGVPWLGHTCGLCSYCREGAENLCDNPLFTGYTRDGGFATHTIADAEYAFDLDRMADPVAIAPLLCAGLIGCGGRSRKPAKAGGLAYTVSVPPLISLPRSQSGKAGRCLRSHGATIAPRSSSRSLSVSPGPAVPTRFLPKRWMRR